MPLRLAFMGTPDFAVPALRALADAGHEIAAVYCQPPRPAGRGHRERPSPVQAAAEALGLPVRTPVSLRQPDEHAAFTALELDVAVAAAYGLILPKPILAAPKHGCLNIHASLLPRWRGAAPIQRAILAGDPETGITIMQMDEGLDTGAMLLQETIPITDATTAETLHDALADCGARLIVKALEQVAAGTLAPRPQPEDGVTYAKKIQPADARIDWHAGAAAIDRTVRAFAPRPGAWFEADGKRIKLLATEAARGAGKPGTVLDDALTIACGDGAIRATRLQREGRRAMDAAEFLRGAGIVKGMRLS
jgi:methionyl-tRNA formyltransferase